MTFGFSPQDEFEDTLHDGITAAKNESYRLAQRLLEKAARMQPYDARPWIWLTEITDDLDEKRAYLENALAADPGNSAARRGLALLTGKIKAAELLPIGEGIRPREAQTPVAAHTLQKFTCPQCGGRVEFDLQAQNAACIYCGFQQAVEQQPAAGVSEQVLDFVLPTARGHHWAEGQRHLRCSSCGAESLWPVGQSALSCPFCGSNQMIESEETANLVDPQAIGLMEIDPIKAQEFVKTWFGEGWFSPDDLIQASRKIALRPAYYPFWTFDGTLELNWRCDVNEGNSDAPNWVACSGVEYKMFDDILISGNQAITPKDIRALSPFKLKEIVEFQPEFLAGWPALTYDIPLSEAALGGREQVIREARRNLHRRVMPGKEKRNLTTGAVNWSGMTFNYVLLPLWIGQYRYKGQDFNIVMNGQTGEISGEKPRDNLKAAAIIISIALTVVVVIAFLALIAAEMGWIRF